jgi:CheY-like chemotaxis protein
VKVLIAEDDAVSRTVLKRTVEKSGHECLVAKDGLEAWEAYQSTPDVDAVVSDWMMPNMDGLELCRRVRGHERAGYTFFVFVTALSGKEKLLEGMKAGADEYLTKPLDGEQLRVKLISASRVTSLHRHLQAEENKDAASDGDGGAGRENGRGTAVEVPRARKNRLRRGNVWEILLAQNKIGEEQLQQALEAQKGNRRELGKALVSLGFITDADLAQAQAQRLNLDYVVLDGATARRSASCPRGCSASTRPCRSGRRRGAWSSR